MPLSEPRARRAVVMQAPRLMLPLLADILDDAGVTRVVSYRRASTRTLRRADPDIVLIDANARAKATFEVIRRARMQTSATIVVLARCEDALWAAMARAIGADCVLGPGADRHDLLTALRELSIGRSADARECA